MVEEEEEEEDEVEKEEEEGEPMARTSASKIKVEGHKLKYRIIEGYRDSKSRVDTQSS